MSEDTQKEKVKGYLEGQSRSSTLLCESSQRGVLQIEQGLASGNRATNGDHSKTKRNHQLQTEPTQNQGVDERVRRITFQAVGRSLEEEGQLSTRHEEENGGVVKADRTSEKGESIETCV